MIKPMVYSAKRTGIELIADGKYKGINYYVLNIDGSQPCAYIELESSHPLFGKKFACWEDDENSFSLNVHGGVTYESDGLRCVDPNGERGSKFVGWDYGHCCDFQGFYLRDQETLEMFKDRRRWTTEEVVQEIKEAIDLMEIKEAAIHFHPGENK